MIDADSLQMMRDTVGGEANEAILPDTAVVNRRTITRTATGGHGGSMAAAGTIALRYWQLTSEEIEFLGKIDARGSHMAVTTYDADVRLDDTLTIDGQTFEVTAVIDQMSTLWHKRIAMAQFG